MSIVKSRNYDIYNVGMSALHDYLFGKNSYNKGDNPFPVILITNATIRILKKYLSDFVEEENIIKAKIEDIPVTVMRIPLEDYLATQSINNAKIATTYNNKFIIDKSNATFNDLKQISINNKAINNVEELFNVFNVISILGWDVSLPSLRYLKMKLKSNDIDKLHFGAMIRSIMTHKHFYKVLEIMNNIGIFDRFLVSLKNVNYSIINHLSKNGHFILETLALLYIGKDINNALNELGEMGILDNNEMEEFKWLLMHIDICRLEDNIKIRLALLEATNILKNADIHKMHKLVLRLIRIDKVLHKSETPKGNAVLFNLCCRPYFSNQIALNITDEEKKQLIQLLLMEENYPINNEKLTEYYLAHFYHRGYGGKNIPTSKEV